MIGKEIVKLKTRLVNLLAKMPSTTSSEVTAKAHVRNALNELEEASRHWCFVAMEETQQ